MKSKLKTKVITGQEQVNLENLETIVISNHSEVATTFLLNGIKRSLIPFNATNGLPIAPFEINSNFGFDVDLEFTESNTNIVIDYLQLPQNNC